MIVTTLRRAMEQLDKLSGERAGLEEALKVGHLEPGRAAIACLGMQLWQCCCLGNWRHCGGSFDDSPS